MATDRYPALRDAYLKAERALLDDLATPPAVVMPPVNRWPHAPGWPLLLDAPGNALNEWTQILWDVGNPPYVSIVDDPGAPCSPAKVVQIKYPTGFVCGAAPGTPYKAFPQKVKQVYVGGYFKHNTNWQPHVGSATSKLFFLFHASLGSIFMAMYGSQNPYELRMYQQFVGGSSGSVSPPPTANGWFVPQTPGPVTTGTWFQVEVKIDLSQTPSITEWWKDGILLARYTGIAYPSDGLSEFKLSPTYGGTQPTEYKSHDDFLWCDHLRIEGQ